MAYHPGTNCAYVPVINNCANFTSGKAFFIKGQPYWGSSLTLIDNEASGAFKAIDVLWYFQCGSGHHASPITYQLDGKQYLAVCAGWGGWTAGFAGDGAPWLRDARRGNTLFVFALPD